MMLPTHALAGMVLALPVALAAPEYAGVVLLAGLLGGVLPDLDLYVAHRKTLHYPVYYSVAGAGAVVTAVLIPTPTTVAAAVFLVAAAVHSVSDVFGAVWNSVPGRRPPSGPSTTTSGAGGSPRVAGWATTALSLTWRSPSGWPSRC